METLWEYPEGEGSTRQHVIRGRITPYPFIYNFWQKWYPFLICFICKWHPFYILIFPFPLGLWNSGVQLYLKPEKGSCVGAARKVSPDCSQKTMTCHSFNCFSFCLGSGLGTIADFSSKQLPHDRKREPFWVEPPCVGHYSEYPHFPPKDDYIVMFPDAAI